MKDRGLWSARDDDSTEYELIELLAALVRAEKPEVCVEVGTHVGLTAEAIGTALTLNGRGRLVSFETDPIRAGSARRRVYQLPVKIENMRDLDFDPRELAPVCFLFVDGEDRERSLHHWLPCCREGALVAVHDTLHPTYREPRQALGVVEGPVFDIVTPCGLSLFRV